MKNPTINIYQPQKTKEEIELEKVFTKLDLILQSENTKGVQITAPHSEITTGGEEVIKTKYATVPYVLHKKAGTNSVKEIVFEVETIENPNTAKQEIDCELAVILDVS